MRTTMSRIRGILIFASMFLMPVTPVVAAPAKDEQSCVDLLKALYATPDTGGEVAAPRATRTVQFEDGSSLGLIDPLIEDRIRVARGTLQVQHRDDVAVVLKIVRRTRNRNALVAWNASGRLDASVLRNRPTSVEILNAIPTQQAGFQRVFDDPTPVHPDVLGGYARRVRKITRQNSPSGGPPIRGVDLQGIPRQAEATVADHVRDRIAAQKPDGLLIITAHIDDIGDVRFDDGSRLPLNQIKSNGQVWVLGCDAVKHVDVNYEAVSGKLMVTAGTPDINRVLDVTRKLTNHARNGKSRTYEDLLRFVQQRRYNFILPLTGVTVLVSASDDTP